MVTKRKPNLHVQIEEKRYHSMKDVRSMLALFPTIPQEAKDCGADSEARKEPLAIAIAGQIERRALTARLACQSKETSNGQSKENLRQDHEATGDNGHARAYSGNLVTKMECVRREVQKIVFYTYKKKSDFLVSERNSLGDHANNNLNK